MSKEVSLKSVFLGSLKQRLFSFSMSIYKNLSKALWCILLIIVCHSSVSWLGLVGFSFGNSYTVKSDTIWEWRSNGNEWPRRLTQRLMVDASWTLSWCCWQAHLHMAFPHGTGFLQHGGWVLQVSYLRDKRVNCKAAYDIAWEVIEMLSFLLHSIF